MRSERLTGWAVGLTAAVLPALPGPSSASPATLPPECVPNGGVVTCTFVDTGADVLDLPAGVTRLVVRAVGGDGEHLDVACPTGAAARQACLDTKARWQGSQVTGAAVVPDGATLALFVGGRGSGRAGGDGGGADGGFGQGELGGGGGGGGASRLAVQGSSPFIVAAGGGGQGGDRDVGPISDQDGEAATTTRPGDDGGVYTEPSGGDGKGAMGGDGGNGFADPNGGTAAGGGGGGGGLFGGGGGGGGYCSLDTGDCPPAGDGGQGSDRVPTGGATTRGAPNDRPQVAVSFELPSIGPVAAPPAPVPPDPTVPDDPDTTTTTASTTTTARDRDEGEGDVELTARERRDARDGSDGSSNSSPAIGGVGALLLAGLIMALVKRRRSKERPEAR